MKYFKTWQEAMAWFLAEYGHNYSDSYTLAAEFEYKLQQNKNGAYFIYIDGGII